MAWPMRGNFHGQKKEMVRAGDETQRRDGPEEKRVQAIRPEEDRPLGKEIGGEQPAEKIDAETLGHVDALVLRESRGEESFYRPEKETGAGEERAEKTAWFLNGEG
jgi:hypothetical protein